MIVSFDYDTEYNGPSLPVVEVTLKNPVTDRATTVQGVLVDSGADGTIAPLRRLKQIQARRVDTVNMRPMRGPTFRVDLYEVELQIGVFRIPRALVVADPQNEGVILGRNVLNPFIVTLNGLANVVEISQ
jgi:predicted aspartyl protease